MSAAFTWPFVHRTIAEVKAAGDWWPESRRDRSTAAPANPLLYEGVSISLTPALALLADTLIRADSQFISGERVNALFGKPADSNLAKVQIFNLRKRFADHGLAAPIVASWGNGWRWAQ